MNQPFFSIICVHNDPEKLERYLLAGLRKQSLQYELILLDNRNNSYSSAAKALNEGGNKAIGKYLIFIHQDVELLGSDWLQMAQTIVQSIGDFGVIGVAGKISEQDQLYSNGFHGRTSEPMGKSFTGNRIPALSVDECLYIIPKSFFSELKFDEKACDHWHLYAADYCYAARARGHSVHLISLPIYHASMGDSVLLSFGNKSKGYYDTLRRLLKKYSSSKIFATSTGNWSTRTPLWLQRVKYVIIVSLLMFYKKFMKNNFMGKIVRTALKPYP